MELLASQQPGKGNEIQLTDAMARSLDREAMYAVVIDPLSGYDTGTPLRLDRHQRPHGRERPPLRRRVLGGDRRARRLGALGMLNSR